MEQAAVSDAKPLRIVVVDDQRLLRDGITALLETDARLHVVGRGCNGQEAIDLVGAMAPDIVLLDIRMPAVDGIQAIREIKSRWPETRIVVLTAYIHDGYVVEGLIAGADGYLLKDASPEALISGVIAVAAGQQVMEPSVARHVADLLNKQGSERSRMYDGLTQRELQMMSMIARGLVAKEIGHELRISEKTVRNHISNIYRKLGIFDRSQAVLYAIKKGLVAED